jgi:hypothetical protein
MSETEATHNEDTLQQAAHASINQEDERDSVSSSLSPSSSSLCCLLLGSIHV